MVYSSLSVSKNDYCSYSIVDGCWPFCNEKLLRLTLKIDLCPCCTIHFLDFIACLGEIKRMACARTNECVQTDKCTKIHVFQMKISLLF